MFTMETFIEDNISTKVAVSGFGATRGEGSGVFTLRTVSNDDEVEGEDHPCFSVKTENNETCFKIVTNEGECFVTVEDEGRDIEEVETLTFEPYGLINAFGIHFTSVDSLYVVGESYNSGQKKMYLMEIPFTANIDGGITSLNTPFRQVSLDMIDVEDLPRNLGNISVVRGHSNIFSGVLCVSDWGGLHIFVETVNFTVVSWFEAGQQVQYDFFADNKLVYGNWLGGQTACTVADVQTTMTYFKSRDSNNVIEDTDVCSQNGTYLCNGAIQTLARREINSRGDLASISKTSAGVQIDIGGMIEQTIFDCGEDNKRCVYIHNGDIKIVIYDTNIVPPFLFSAIGDYVSFSWGVNGSNGETYYYDITDLAQGVNVNPTPKHKQTVIANTISGSYGLYLKVYDDPHLYQVPLFSLFPPETF